jgi:hypothetical protein
MRNNKKYQKYIVLGFACLFVLAVTLFILEKTHTTDLVKKPSNTDQHSSDAKTTSKQPSAQSDFSSGQPRKEVTQSNMNEGVVNDNKGVIDSVPSESVWTKSADGSSVIVYGPAANQTLKSGQKLTGTSTATVVNFRLIDNVQGVIATGTIDVIDGKFSGTFDFSTTADQGQVDIFTTAPNGSEANTVSIPVRFNG